MVIKLQRSPVCGGCPPSHAAPLSVFKVPGGSVIQRPELPATDGFLPDRYRFISFPSRDALSSMKIGYARLIGFRDGTYDFYLISYLFPKSGGVFPFSKFRAS